MSGPVAAPVTATTTVGSLPLWQQYFLSKQPPAGTTSISRGHRLALAKLYIALMGAEFQADHSVDVGTPAASAATVTSAPPAAAATADGSGTGTGTDTGIGTGS